MFTKFYAQSDPPDETPESGDVSTEWDDTWGEDTGSGDAGNDTGGSDESV